MGFGITESRAFSTTSCQPPFGSNAPSRPLRDRTSSQRSPWTFPAMNAVKANHLIILPPFLIPSSIFLPSADFRLAPALSNRMVLQREKSIAVWGGPRRERAGRFPLQVIPSLPRRAWMENARSSADALAASAAPRTLVVSGKDGHRRCMSKGNFLTTRQACTPRHFARTTGRCR